MESIFIIIERKISRKPINSQPSFRPRKSITELSWHILQILIYYKDKKKERDCRNLHGTQEVSCICFISSLFLKSRCRTLMEKMCQLFSRVWLSATPGTVAHQAPLSTPCSRQECWSGLPFPSPDGENSLAVFFFPSKSRVCAFIFYIMESWMRFLTNSASLLPIFLGLCKNQNTVYAFYSFENICASGRTGS